MSIPGWGGNPFVVHGFFTRRGGVSPVPYASLNVGPRGGDDPLNVEKNLVRIAQSLSIPADRILCPRQVHSDRVEPVTDNRGSIFSPGAPLRADGMITDERDLYLGILTADCLPILLLDPRRPAVGAVHAGWRGTLRGIASRVVTMMYRIYGSRPADLAVALGPAIGPCCYLVGEEVARSFLHRCPDAAPSCLNSLGTDRWRLNLPAMNRHQLIRAGVREANITQVDLCTSCRRDLFFSARADGEPTGRQVSLIGLRP